MEKNQFRRGLYILTISTEYLHLVKNVVGENIKKGNPWMISGDTRIIDGQYEEMTKWSDFNTSSPILFNFYHGLELLLKGFLILKENYVLEPSHLVEKLFEEFKKNYNEKQGLISVLNKYLTLESMPPFLASCLKDNNIQINNLYEFFRYPFDKQFQKEYDYSRLKHQEEKGLTFFKEFEGDIDTLLKEAVKLYREIEKEQKTI